MPDTYADARIGILTEWAQRWVSRNFPLDHTLEELEQVLDGAARDTVRQARDVLKEAAADLLDGMLAVLDGGYDVVSLTTLDRICEGLCEGTLGRLRQRMTTTVAEVCAALPTAQAAALTHQYDQWAAASRPWHLINAGTPAAPDPSRSGKAP
ncbi:hypothetical protein [Streptosporangium sp. NPDC002524]|uniref:hypothetical protein n=1 Tax=Streptosporangium sp. NPDC002524 TaxID=3154537 RepID=UPI003324F6FA